MMISQNPYFNDLEVEQPLLIRGFDFGAESRASRAGFCEAFGDVPATLTRDVAGQAATSLAPAKILSTYGNWCANQSREIPYVFQVCTAAACAVPTA